MSADGKERTSLATFRFIFAFGGSLLVLAAAEPLVDVFSKIGNGPVNLAIGMAACNSSFCCSGNYLFLAYFFMDTGKDKTRNRKDFVEKDLSDLLHNSPWFILLGAGISAIFFNSIRDGAAIYYFKYYIQGQSAFSIKAVNLTITLSSLYFVIGQAANIIGVILAKPVSDRIGKKYTFLYAMLFATVFSIAFYWLDKNNIILVFIFQLLISISAGIIFPLVWSMYADTADYSEWKTGRRATGLVFLRFFHVTKIRLDNRRRNGRMASGYYGFKANVVQTIEAQNGIRMMLSFFLR